jgi:hypothetical protein
MRKKVSAHAFTPRRSTGGRVRHLAYIRGARPDVNLATGYSRFKNGTFHTCPNSISGHQMPPAWAR